MELKGAARIYALIPSFVGIAIIVLHYLDFIIDGGLQVAIGYPLITNFAGWLTLVSPYLVLISVSIIIRTYMRNVRERARKWQYSYLVLGSFLAVVIVGLTLGPENEQYSFVIDNIANATYLSIYGISGVSLALGLARAYQIRSYTTAAMLFFTFVAIASFSTIGELIGPWFMDFGNATGQSLRASIWSFGYSSLVYSIAAVAILVRVITFKEKLRAFGGD